MMNMDQQKSSVAMLSVISNSVLVGLKVAVGLLIGSVSVISEAIHSGVDLLAALIAWFAVRQSGKPADKDHPFGHGKYENVSGTIEALLIFFAAAWIIYEAVHKLRHPAPMGEAGWGVAVMFVSASANWWVSGKLFKVGQETDSVALQADAWHLRTDVYTSTGVMAGLGLVWLGGWLFPTVNLHWLDPAAAIAVALLIIKAAWHLTIEAGRDLFDASLPAEEERLISEHIALYSPIVRGFHRLRTRKAGSQRFAEFHMLVDSQMTVEKSHEIADIIIAAIKEHYPDTTITIHIEPCKAECKPSCSEDCLLIEEERSCIRSSIQQRKGQ